MNLNDEIFQKVEKKTKVSKETIIELAKKIQDGKMKDEGTLRDVIHTLSHLTGKEVPKEREDKIIETILSDKVPKGVEKMF